MPKKLRILSVTFDAQIEPWELPYLRAAIAHQAGWEHEMFHNHNGETGGFHYRLPLIQYKHHRGRPMLLCLNEGIDEAYHFFSHPNWNVLINGRDVPIGISRLDVREYHLTTPQERPRLYHIRHWIALNEDNYATYTRLPGMVERLFLLEKILQNQIVAFLQEVDCAPDWGVEVKLLDKKDERWVSYKGVRVLAFSLEFSSNVFLPDYIGLGKGCSSGWGVVRPIPAKKPSFTFGNPASEVE